MMKQYVGGEIILKRMQMVSEVVVQKCGAPMLWCLTGNNTERIVVLTEVPNTVVAYCNLPGTEYYLPSSPQNITVVEQ
jgi:hypothetical protein